MGWATENSWFVSRQGQEIVHRVRTGGGVQLASDSMGNGGKAEHSAPFSAVGKSEWSHIYVHTICLHGVHKENFTVSIIYA